jgi:hypothetical protein
VTRRELAAAALLLAAAAAPFWAGRFLPFLDLPQHLGLAAVVARHADPTTAFARTYALDLRPTPYWGYYAAMWLLSRALALETANRVLFTAYAIAIPLASAYLLASFGRDRRWAVFAVPLAFGTNLFFGFATFLLSIPLFLVALGLAERHLAAAHPRPRVAIALAAATCAVYLCHAQTYLLLGLCVAVLLAAHARGVRWTITRAVPFLPSLALFGEWFWRSFVLREAAASAAAHTVHHGGYGRVGELGAVWEPWQVVLGTMAERTFGAFTDGSDRRLGGVLLVAFAAALALAYGPAPVQGDGDQPAPVRRWLLPRRCELLVVALLASYLLAPMEISGQWYVNPRHLVFAALALPLLLARPATGARAAVAAAAAAVALAVCANAGLKIGAFQRQVGPFDAIEAALPVGGRVLGLPFDLGAAGPVRLWPFVHFACYAQVLAGDDVGFSFAGLPSIPVRYRPGMQAPHPYEWTADAFDWRSMGPAYDAFLVSGTPRGRGGADLRLHAEVVARGGAFTLWRPKGGLTGRPASSR